jgi:hypothetical protein
MEHLILPSVGVSFKKWGCCTPILPKALAHFPNFQKKKDQKNKTISRNFFLPSTFCASGQLLLVGFSTCPPCPDFS